MHRFHSLFLGFLTIAMSSFSGGDVHATPQNQQIQQATLSVSLWPTQHKMLVDATLSLALPPKQHTLTLFLPQIIQVKTIFIKQKHRWKAFPFKRQLETVTLSLPSKRASRVVLKIHYTITFHSRKNYLFRAIFCRIDPEETYFLYGWYPSLSPFADPLTGQLLKNRPFPYRLHIEVPAHQTALASGRLLRTKRLQTGRMRYTYQQAAIKEAAIFLAAAPFKKIVQTPTKKVRVVFYLHRQDGPKNIKELSQLSVKAEQFYRRLWGSPTASPLRPILWRFVSFGGSGARGYPFTLLLDREQGFFHKKLSGYVDRLFSRRQVLLHEMAHTWWGNAVTGVGKGSMWLSEGMANYASIRALGALYGKRAENEARRRHIRYFLTGKGSGKLFRSGGLAQMARRTAYTKGALVFFELERHIGRPVLDRGLRSYFRTYRNQFTNVQNLRKTLEKAAHRSLKSFFQAWIYGQGLPFVRLLRWHSQTTRQQTYKLTLTLQNQGTIFSDALVRIIYKNHHEDKLLHVPAGQQKTYRLPLAHKPMNVLVDPEQTMLHGYRTKALFALANRLRRKGHYKRAKKLFLQLLQHVPKHGYAHYSLGLLLQKQGEAQKALQHFRIASNAKDPANTPFWLPLWSRYRMGILLQKRKRVKEAKQLFQSILKQKQNPYNIKERTKMALTK